MSVISYKNFAYVRGPKGDPGPKGEKGAKGDPGDIGSLIVSGRLNYDPVNRILGFDETGLATETYVNDIVTSTVESTVIDGGSF